MRIHKKGFFPISIIALSVLLILFVVNIMFPYQTVIHYVLYAVAGVFIYLVVRFFRIPDRHVTYNDEKQIICPADGKVVAIEEVEEKEYFNDKRLQISIFMSPLDAHMNYFPLGGKVNYAKHHPGRHYPAYNPKSSMLNEMTTSVIEDDKGNEIMVRQIAGIMARRIVCNANQGILVKKGEQLGIIKFGSRVDLLLPVDTDVKLKIGQKTKAVADLAAIIK